MILNFHSVRYILKYANYKHSCNSASNLFLILIVIKFIFCLLLFVEVTFDKHHEMIAPIAFHLCSFCFPPAESFLFHLSGNPAPGRLSYSIPPETCPPVVFPIPSLRKPGPRPSSIFLDLSGIPAPGRIFPILSHRRPGLRPSFLFFPSGDQAPGLPQIPCDSHFTHPFQYL